MQQIAVPTVSQKYYWLGFADGRGNWQSSCQIRIFKLHPEQVFVVLEGSPDCEGTSVTNCVEHLLPKIAKEFALDPIITVWLHLEHGYDKNPILSRVTLSIDPNGRRRACWAYVEMAQVEGWIGGKLELCV